MAGESLTLTCSTSIQEGINGSSTLTWTRDSIEQPGEDRSGFLSLSLIPLHTSHGGVYICTARLTIPEAGVDVSESNMTTITVQSMLYNLHFLSITFNIFSCSLHPKCKCFCSLWPTLCWKHSSSHSDLLHLS